MRKTIYNPDTLAPPVGHFDRAVKFGADWLFISGTSALTNVQGDMRKRKLVKGIKAQTHETLDNIERQGFPQALTGPAVRGDVGVVRSHLDALAERAPGFLPLYAALSLASLPIARDKGGLSEINEVQLRELLTASLAEANSGREGAPCA